MRSTAGPGRSANQDSAAAGADFAVVADGVGGHAGGDVASAEVVRQVVGAVAGVEVPDLDPGVGTVAADGLVARCPVTGALWLCGPLGRYERPLALRGPLAADATTEDPATEDPAGLDAVDAPDPAESPDLAAAAGTAGPRTGEGFYL